MVKKLFFLWFLIWVNCQYASSEECSSCVRIITWNIANFGSSKTDEQLTIMAKIINTSDVITIQEVLVSYKGAQAVAKLVDLLSRMGDSWEYKLSPPTSGEGSERYAVLWRKSKIQLLGNPWLEQSLADSIHREPFLARVTNRKDTFLIATMHSVPKSKNPAKENSLLVNIDKRYEKDHLILTGDFNASHRSPAFDNLYSRKLGPTFIDQKTTLKMEPNPTNGEHLASVYDNLFYEKDEIALINKGIIDFSSEFKSLQEARRLSDHIPIWGCFMVKTH